MTTKSQKVSANTILSYLNAPLMAVFRGMNDIIANFIVSQYYNGKLYFDRPIEVSGDIIYRLTRLFKKGEPIPIKSNLGLVKKLAETPAGKNSKGIVISQIQYTHPK